MRRSIKSILILFFLLFLSACDYMKPEPYHNKYVVESTLIANDPLPEVNLFTSVENDEDFNWGEVGVDDAIVEIHLMDDSGEAVEIYPYRKGNSGTYSAEVKHIVLPSRTYEIIVFIPNGNNQNHKLWGRTIVPGSLEVISSAPDTISYQATPLPSVKALIDKNNAAQEAVFMNTYMAGKPYYKNLTPYYASQAEEDTMSTYFDYATQAQELVSEANYPRNPDQSLTIHFPWKDFAYYGPYSIVIQSLDENLYDHLRSANAQFGGGNLAPGQIYNAIDHIEGGIGVFGSMATDTVRTYIKRAE